MQLIKLNNGLEIHNFCYGTSIVSIHRDNFIKRSAFNCYNFLSNRQQFYKDLTGSKIIKTAYLNGCRLFDTSRAYGGSEYNIGKALSKYDRKSYQIITKVSNQDQLHNSVLDGFNKSLRDLKTNYVDIYLMHWPVEGKYIETWKTMENLYEQGKCLAIGVCNFNIHHLQTLFKHCKHKPMINECECHPLFTQNKLREFCKENNIQFLAYTSTARQDERLNNTCIVDIAKKYNKTLSQIILKWHQLIGNIPIVNTFNNKHLKEDLSLDGFNLTEEELTRISSCNINSRLRYDPDNCNFSKL